MRNLFNMDNPVFRFLSRLADLMILNIIFLIFSLPVVTIGASSTALYYVALKIAANEEGYIFRSFWKSFRENFRQATIIWLIVLGVFLVLGLDFSIMNNMTGSLVTAFRVLIPAGAILFFFFLLYVFPTLARFSNSIANTARNAFIMSIAHLPWTILLTVITVGSALITFLNGYTIVYGVLFWIMMGFAVIAYLNSKIFVKIFARYMPEETEVSDENWTLSDAEPAAEAERIPEVIPERQAADVAEAAEAAGISESSTEEQAVEAAGTPDAGVEIQTAEANGASDDTKSDAQQ